MFIQSSGYAKSKVTSLCLYTNLTYVVRAARGSNLVDDATESANSYYWPRLGNRVAKVPRVAVD